MRFFYSRKCNLVSEGSLRFFKEYHNSDCDHLCLVSAVEAACGCTLFYMPHHKGRQCNATSVICIMKVKREYNTVKKGIKCVTLRICTECGCIPLVDDRAPVRHVDGIVIYKNLVK